MPKTNGEETLVYSREMYIEGFSPMVKYFPTDEMFFKLMRASIGVTEIKNLWFYNSDVQE